MIKKFWEKIWKKRYSIDMVKKYLKKYDNLYYDEIKHFTILEDEYISLLEKQEILMLEFSLTEVEYELKRRYINNQNSDRDLTSVMITFFLSVCILYIDDCKYEKFRNFSLVGILAFALMFVLSLFVSHLSKVINESNGETLYWEFKKECIKKAISKKQIK